MSEALQPEPLLYKSFNEFFTRALKDGARSAAGSDGTLVSPADGFISQMGRINQGDIFQAKDRTFSVEALLADEARAKSFEDGWFTTIYLSPRNYHRVHMPCSGRLVETVHVPGRLYTVAPLGVRSIRSLFARNERLVCHFDTSAGPMCIVLVGAMLVSGVETQWGGIEFPEYGSKIRRVRYEHSDIQFDRFSEIARFNFGSTVICLWPELGIQLDQRAAESPIAVGEALGWRQCATSQETVP